MDPARCGGDIVVQACANDPQVAVHAIRNLARVALRHRCGALLAAGLRPHVVDHPRPGHPRNLFGFKDGTNNIKAEDTDMLNEHVWVADGRRTATG